MASARRLISRSAWIAIAFAVLVTIILSASPIEFATMQLESAAQGLLMFGVAGCICLLMLCQINGVDSVWFKVLKVLGAAAGSLAFLIVFGFVGFLATSMCAWSERELLFIHVDDASRQIVIRDYGCGATDSGPPIVRTFEMHRLNSWFNYVGEVDTAQVDLSKWLRATRNR